MSKNKNFAPPYSVSQNFLTSAQTVRRIVSLAKLSKDDHVLEIGAGKGHITQVLCETCENVTAYEIDRKLYRHLSAKFSNTPGLLLRNQDFLQAKLPAGEYKVFANLPYSATSAMLRKLTQGNNPPKDAWLVMEKGAAKRFLGKPAETTASLLLKPFFDMGIVWHFAKTDFHPSPSVDSVMVHLARKENPDFSPALRKQFERFITAGRQGDLSSFLTKKQIFTALRLAGLANIFPDKNTEKHTSGLMLYVQWLCLFRCFLERGKK